LTLVGICTRTDHDVTHEDLKVRSGDSRRRIHRTVVDHQFREHRKRREQGKVGRPGGPAHEGSGATARTFAYANPSARFYTAWWTRVVRFDADGAAELVELPLTEGDNEATETTLVLPDGTARAAFVADLRSEVRPPPGRFGVPIESNWRLGLHGLPAPRGYPRLTDEPPPPLRVEPPRTAVRALAGEPLVADGRRVLYGDLHRHTHVSRCAGAQDGTLLDAYRYARGPGGLDFVAITDHFQQMRSWAWWRNLRDVDRFHEDGRLVAFAAVERAIPDAGHYNDVYLHAEDAAFNLRAWLEPPTPDDTRAGTAPVARTVSIPHMLGRSQSPWSWDRFHPRLHTVLEVYQGTRGSYEGAGVPMQAADVDVPEAGVAEGLARGHAFGLIASSDHGASTCGLAAVVAGAATREAVFAALKERSAFACIDFAELDVSLGALAMGAVGDAPAGAPLRVRARGTAPVAAVEVLKNGAPWRRATGADGPSLFVLTTRRWGPYPPNPLRLRVVGGELVSFRPRTRGEHETRLALEGDVLTLYKEREPLDLALFVAGADALAFELALGDESTTVAAAELPPGASRTLDAPVDRELLWHVGPSLSLAACDLAFEDPERLPGDAYHVRVVFEDGNVAWSSPIRVTEGAAPNERSEDS